MKPDLNETNNKRFTKRFYKENGLWYIDLPEFLDAKLGSKANLLMVQGADTFLDYISKETGDVTLTFSPEEFTNYTAKLDKLGIGMDKEYLDSVGHAPVNYGAYYNVVTFNDKPFAHKLWLCPVTEYVFGGSYPDNIYVKFEMCGDASKRTFGPKEVKKKSFLDKLFS